jgi:hypothetical protein
VEQNLNSNNKCYASPSLLLSLSLSLSLSHTYSLSLSFSLSLIFTEGVEIMSKANQQWSNPVDVMSFCSQMLSDHCDFHVLTLTFSHSQQCCCHFNSHEFAINFPLLSFWLRWCLFITLCLLILYNVCGICKFYQRVVLHTHTHIWKLFFHGFVWSSTVWPLSIDMSQHSSQKQPINL